MVNFGVFIRSVQEDLAIIEKCQNLLVSLQSDTKILHALRREDHGGLKVVLDKDAIVAQLLKKKFLDSTSTIHALTTALILHDAFPNDEEEFKKVIRNKMATKVLNIKKVPLSEKYPDIGTGKWIIILDVPEIEDLDEFMAMGSPNMSLKLSNNNKYKVEFYCRLCQKGGHTQSGCLGLDAPSHPNPRPSTPKKINLPEHLSVKAIPIDSPEQKVSEKIFKATKPVKRSLSGFRIRDIAAERAESVVKLPLVKQDIKAFKVELGREEVKRSLSSNFNTPFEVKKERDADEVPLTAANFDVHANSSRDVNLAHKSWPGECSSTAASSTSKDGLEILYDSTPGPRFTQFQNPFEKVDTTTNIQPPTKRPISDDDSNQSPQPRKTIRILPVVIPDGIRSIICGMPNKVLDIRQLEAFFSHAKKKSRPLEIAEMYTNDVKGLKGQLAEISRKYYMSPNVGSPADIQFVKMLQNLLKRFENTATMPKIVKVQSMIQQQGF